MRVAPEKFSLRARFVWVLGALALLMLLLSFMTF